MEEEVIKKVNKRNFIFSILQILIAAWLVYIILNERNKLNAILLLLILIFGFYFLIKSLKKEKMNVVLLPLIQAVIVGWFTISYYQPLVLNPFKELGRLLLGQTDIISFLFVFVLLFGLLLLLAIISIAFLIDAWKEWKKQKEEKGTLKSAIKKAAIIGIIILLIGAGIFLSWQFINNQKVHEANVAVLKSWKCLAQCPFEKETRQVGEEQLENEKIVAECVYFCTKEYSPEFASIPEKFIEASVFDEFNNCTRYILNRNRSAFLGCVNSKLDEFSGIADMSKEEIEMNYSIINITIEELTCEEDKAIVKIRLNEGRNIKELQFRISDNTGHMGTAKRTNIPEEGKTENYEIRCSELEFLNRPINLSKPRSAELSIKTNEDAILYKDFKLC